MNLKKHWATWEKSLKKFSTAFIRDTDKLDEFKIIPNYRFQALQDQLEEEDTTMEDKWKEIKEVPLSTCYVLSRKKHRHKECIFIKILDHDSRKEE